MEKLPTRNAPDPKACAVARAVGESVHPDRVILFGSRARGDYSPDSDVDLLVITDSDTLDNGSYQRASSIAHGKAAELYGGSIGVDLVEMSESGFPLRSSRAQPRGRPGRPRRIRHQWR